MEQTEGRPLPAFARTTGDPREFTERLKAFVARHGIALEYDRSIAPAHGDSSGGRIRLLPDLPAAEEFSTLAHETAHELLHHKLERVTLDKTVLETQAEAVAYVVCQGVGLESHRAAADYITLYKGDAKTLAESLAAVQQTASRILNDLLPDDRGVPDRKGERDRAQQDSAETATRAKALNAPPRQARSRRTRFRGIGEGLMALQPALFGSATGEWETPPELFAKLNLEFVFTLDVCATSRNRKCPAYFSRADNGLAHRWTGACWMNPPYGRQIGLWVQKARDESRRQATVVGLLPARTDTAWWHEHVMRAHEIRLLKGRLTFVGAPSPAPFPSAVVIFKRNRMRRVAPRVMSWNWRSAALT